MKEDKRLLLLSSLIPHPSSLHHLALAAGGPLLLPFQSAGHLEMVLKGGQSPASNRSQVGILPVSGLFLNKRDRFFMVPDHVSRKVAVEGGSLLFTESIHQFLVCLIQLG